ncbi:DUF4262 domain-containing protein [Croceicoccus gelatinilyticus]|uniref:DUF4262 domain-containing protein n=1 Tax=Croceicoccus gelatinilyticus TaxID=2835536 RepID=UPI001BD0570A|nr:DUF4262 domain-containing protein [Croceicoccus gelatinilyticus]MBS7671593.1 DUF4262 domain-containing protein [Croceicoccus gelatinilyticus]
MTPKQQKEYAAKIDALVAKHGIAVQFVFGERGEVPFTYSVGRAEKGKSELLVNSLPFDAAQYLVNEMVRILDERGTEPTHGEIIDLGHIKVRFDLAPGAEKTHAFQAVARLARALKLPDDRPTPPFETYQIVWPDKEGRFPDDAGYAADKFPQPLYSQQHPPKQSS